MLTEREWWATVSQEKWLVHYQVTQGAGIGHTTKGQSCSSLPLCRIKWETFAHSCSILFVFALVHNKE